jgi:hypothetical protein
MDYRTRVAYAFSRSGNYKPFNDMNEWLGNAGTKLSLLVKLLQHTLSHDERAPPSFDDEGRGKYPEIPPVPDGQRAPQSSKVLIFQEFPMMAEMIASVCLVPMSKTPNM